MDELNAIKNAFNCGVNIMATVHASSVTELRAKNEFKELLNSKCFSRFVVLSSRQGPGTLEGVYNENLTRIASWS